MGKIPRNAELEKLLRANALKCDWTGEVFQPAAGTVITVCEGGAVMVHSPEAARCQQEHDARQLAAFLVAQEANGTFVQQDGQVFDPKMSTLAT